MSRIDKKMDAVVRRMEKYGYRDIEVDRPYVHGVVGDINVCVGCRDWDAYTLSIDSTPTEHAFILRNLERSLNLIAQGGHEVWERLYLGWGMIEDDW